MSKSYPPRYFYHLVFENNYHSVLEHGLQSTAGLLTIANMPPQERENILTHQRIGSTLLPNGIMLRDQSPMPPHALKKALPPHISPADWYRLLNNFVFLWPDLARLTRHWRAGASIPQHLFVFDAPRIVADLEERLYVSAINTGNARRQPAPRSPETLVPYSIWKEFGWPEYLGKKRASHELPAEILVRDSLPLKPYLLGILPIEILATPSLTSDDLAQHLKKYSVLM